MEALAARLARMPNKQNCGEMERMFHLALDKLREAEEAERGLTI